VLRALDGRLACLMANHGALAYGRDLAAAMWRAVELEALARQYLLALQAGPPPALLTEAEIAEALAMFAGYGR
jgi:L-fuculose-phosphate aldolase